MIRLAVLEDVIPLTSCFQFIYLALVFIDTTSSTQTPFLAVYKQLFIAKHYISY